MTKLKPILQLLKINLLGLKNTSYLTVWTKELGHECTRWTVDGFNPKTIGSWSCPTASFLRRFSIGVLFSNVVRRKVFNIQFHICNRFLHGCKPINFKLLARCIWSSTNLYQNFSFIKDWFYMILRLYDERTQLLRNVSSGIESDEREIWCHSFGCYDKSSLMTISSVAYHRFLNGVGWLYS